MKAPKKVLSVLLALTLVLGVAPLALAEEPAGTAGRPILEAIKRAELHNTVIVVTRYFGGVLLGAAGAVLLILISSRGESGGGSIAGDIITLVSSVCYAIYLTACRKVILKYSPVTTMKWMFFFAAIVVVVLYHRPALEVDFPAVPARVWGGAAFAIVLSTFLAYLMVPIAQHYLRPTVISMYNYVQPVASVLFTVVLGLDVFGFTKAAAAGCIFLGVWLVTMSKSRKDLEAEQAVKMTDKK